MRGPSPKYRAQGIECNVKTPGSTGTTECEPVFLKTFGSEVAYTIEQEGNRENVFVGGYDEADGADAEHCRGGMVRR